MIEIYPKNYEEFKSLSEKADVVPFYATFLSDFETPVSAFLKISRGSYNFLFESAEQEEKLGRYSFIGCHPEIIVKGIKDKVEIINYSTGEKREVEIKLSLNIIDEFLKKYKTFKINDLPSFTGGFVGFISYDYVRKIENLPNMTSPCYENSNFIFFFPKKIIIFDHFKRKMFFLTNVFVEKENMKRKYEEGMETILNFLSDFQKSSIVLKQGHFVESNQDFKSNFKFEEFIEGVKRVKKYIFEGDIIQAVISQRWEKKIDIEPFKIYRALRSINPSPYMFYLQMDDLKMIGSSPEILVKLENGIATVRPIAGTRKRGKDEKEEKKLEEELINDEKEKAEHIMLVDLGRNDLGRVCYPGSVRVNQLMKIEKYSHVMHIVSNVEGKIKKNKTSIDLIHSTFPAGTVTGAPKIRAMEIIEEIEPVKRGPYAGAVGYFSLQNSIDFCITIRTFVLKNDIIYLQTGAGIVADSIPEREFIETKNKAKGLFEAYNLSKRI